MHTQKKLFTPIQIGPITLKHRVVMPPMSRLRAQWPSGIPSDLQLEYYRQRASDGGVIFTEATGVPTSGRGYKGAPGLYSDEQVTGWKRITDAVHAKGGYIFTQLWHAGRTTHIAVTGEEPITASVDPAYWANPNYVFVVTPDGFSQPSPHRALKTAEIPGIIEQYRIAAVNAKRGGFDGVEVMAANGHLIDQFLQDNSNKRTDRYGGSIENRTQLLVEIVEALIDVWGANRVGVRIAPSGTYNDMADSNPRALFRYVAERLNAFGLATVINIFILVFGLAAAAFLPVAQYPNIVPPTVQITTAYPGASAETIARTVATPLEQAINGVENMDYISSQSTSNGLLTITVIFKIGTDINTGLMLTHNRVQDTLSRLPQEVQLQGVQVKKTIPAYLLGIHPYSPDGSRDVQYISNYMILHVKDEIARLPGVSDLLSLGERQFAMRIWIDPDKAAVHDISANEILAALRAQNVQVSAGVLNQPPVPAQGKAGYQVNVEALGRLTTPEQFGNVIVKSDDQGHVTRIHDIGRVELGATDYGSIAYADRSPSAPFWVFAVPGSNVVTVEHEVLDKMKELKKSFPPGLDYQIIYDPTTFVSNSIDEVVKTIVIAILLVIGVVYAFLQSWRATIIPVIAISVSLVGSFTILAAFGISINQLSLFGLVLAVGIVVDDAIVVVENVERNMRAGMSPLEAAHRTMDEVGGALISNALQR